jgi:hypothetical protein
MWRLLVTGYSQPGVPWRACGVAIEMAELPACDLPGAVRGDGDQGVAAGVIP